MQNSTDLKFKDNYYVKFRNSIYYDMPLGDSPISHYENWLYLIHNVKLEILANLQVMPLLSVVPYLQKLKIEIEEDLKGCSTSKYQYDDLLKRFEITEREVLYGEKKSNILFKVLCSPAVTDKNLSAEKFHEEAEDLQFIFFNYHLGQFAQQLLDFLKEQLAYYKQLTIQNHVKENSNPTELSYTAYNVFLKNIHYNYPLGRAPIGSYYNWKDDIREVKAEIIENLTLLDVSKRDLYLEKLFLEIHEHLEDDNQSSRDYQELLQRYDISEMEVLNHVKYENVLCRVIRANPISDYNNAAEQIAPNAFVLQDTFYKYYYNKTILEVLRFIAGKMTNGAELLKSIQSTTSTDDNFLENPFGDEKMITPFSFNDWAKDSGRITALHQSLKTNGFIDTSVTLPVFKKLFEGKPFESKIKWTGNLTQLAYFIKQLISKDSIVCKKQEHWKIVVQYIEMADGKVLENRTLTRQKKPADTSLLDEALQAL